jgi:hypothetical protein
LGVVATMRLFASAREAAGTGSDVFAVLDGATVADVPQFLDVMFYFMSNVFTYFII